jgi:membrane protease YdiL (CAAX protease family)
MGETRAADVGLFFGLVAVLTLPFWLAGGATGILLMPGLPLAGLAVVCPAATAVILTLRRGGLPAARRLLARVADGSQVKPAVWWLATILVTPILAAVAFAILRLGGSAIPDPSFSAPTVLALSAAFLIGGLCEELGWTGFALEPLRDRFGPLAAAVIIGGAWAAWHYPALLQAHRSLAWIGWWTLGTVGLRLLMVWLYEQAGPSLLLVAVFHAMSNLAWQLFPVRGSWFDPRLHGLLTAGLALLLFLVWRPRALTT